jgi:hypothetical protein
MYKEKLKEFIQHCDAATECLKKISTENDLHKCNNHLFMALVYSANIKEFMYSNYEFFDSMLCIDELISDLDLFQDDTSILNIKSISKPCISQLSIIRGSLVKSELSYDELNNCC